MFDVIQSDVAFTKSSALEWLFMMSGVNIIPPNIQIWNFVESAVSIGLYMEKLK